MSHIHIEDGFAAFIGLDWADAKHDVCVRAAGTEKLEYAVIEHTPEAIAAWVEGLRTRFGGKPIALALELKRGPVVAALHEHPLLNLFYVQPQTLAMYRRAFTPSHAKDDPSDARIAQELLTKHRDRLRPVKRGSVAMRSLQRLVQARRSLVDDRVRTTNRITAALKCYFPQVLKWFRDKYTRVFCDFVQRWPELKNVKRARDTTIEKFFADHNVRYKSVVTKRIQAIRNASPLTSDEGVIAPYKLIVKALITQLRAIIAATEQLDCEIDRLTDRLPDFKLFRSLPGAGKVFAPRLLALFGEDRDHFATAAEAQRMVGVAPVTERSGKKSWVHWRYRCRTFSRQTIVEWAGETVPLSSWAGAYYRLRKAKGERHQAILRSLAFKWMRILFRCWKQRTPYDEGVYVDALRRRGSPVIAAMEETPALG